MAFEFEYPLGCVTRTLFAVNYQSSIPKNQNPQYIAFLFATTETDHIVIVFECPHLVLFYQFDFIMSLDA